MSKTMDDDARRSDAGYEGRLGRRCLCHTCMVERAEDALAAAHCDDTAPVPGHPPLRLTEDSAARKRIPLASGLLDYFPDALAAVAEVSLLGNEKHNPGEPLHWARSKAPDEADALLRHLVDRGTRDTAGVRHSAQVAWRALALLQREIEAERGLPPSRGSR